jgi:peptidoglycan/LPS O-acetylase OafA/YrhL
MAVQECRMVRHQNNFNLLRLAAAIQVVIVHSVNHLGVGQTPLDIIKIVPGVPIFYCISGYLIRRSYARLRDSGDLLFLRNRIFRIYPGLFACFIFSIVATYYSGYFNTIEISSASFITWTVAQLSFVQFYNPDFMRGFGVGVLNGSLWTITVELQFYVLTPFLFWLFHQRRAWFGFVAIASVIANCYLRIFHEDGLFFQKLLGVSFLPWLYMYLLGFVLSDATTLIRGIKRTWWLLLVLAFLVCQLTLGDLRLNASNAIHPVSFLCLALIVLWLAENSLLELSFLGEFIRKNDLSYGLYLYHMPIINIIIYLGWMTATAGLLFVVVFSAVLAVLSWYAIEQPFLRRKK